MSALARLYSVRLLAGGRVSILPHPRGGDWLADDLKALRTLEDVDVLVSLLMEEEIHEIGLQDESLFCQEQGIVFLRYPIPDHHVPPRSQATYTLLETLQGCLVAGQHVAVHCFMGLGRSALVAACLLVLSGLTPENACQALSQARGYQVPETSEQRAWVRDFPQFYRDYCLALRDIL